MSWSLLCLPPSTLLSLRSLHFSPGLDTWAGTCAALRRGMLAGDCTLESGRLQGMGG